MISINDFRPTDFNFDVDNDYAWWWCTDDHVCIDDPLLAVIVATNDPNITKRFCHWYDSRVFGSFQDSHFKDLISLPIQLQLIADFQDYHAGCIINVTLNDSGDNSIYAFTLPNGYMVESIREAIKHFRLI